MKRLCSAVLVILLAGAGCNSAPTLSLDTLKAAVHQTPDEAALATIYQAFDWQSPWSSDNVRALEKALDDRARHGLDQVQFLARTDKDGSNEALDVMRTRATLTYAHALADGYVDPNSLHRIYTLPIPKADVAADLAKALKNENLEDWLESLAPQDREYAALSASYLENRKLAQERKDPVIPEAGGLIKEGEQDRRVPEVVRQLTASGYLRAENAGPAPTDRFTREIAESLKEFQRDYGITADGVIGPDTLALLNMGPSARARATAVALERRRWLARKPALTRIDVNIPAAELTYWRDGKIADVRKVIVGQVDHETPQLLSPLFRLVANPTWTVPKSIQTTEMADKGDAYFAEHNMELRDGWIVQKPGPDNALGLVKFDLKNDFAIYLHDTNARSLFTRSQRQLSHGCVRVSDALGFADMIARNEGVAAEWQRARRTGEETFVPLPREIPVRLLYHPTFVSSDGTVNVRTDPYDWNEPIAKKLGFMKRERSAFRGRGSDFGP